MSENILLGCILGLTIGTSLFVYNTDKFSKNQKIFLIICFVFPPLQWVLILVLLGLNSHKEQNSPEALKEKQVLKETSSFDDKINSLKELKDKEILTEQEYNEKVKNLEKSKSEHQLKNTEDYKKLKSLFEDGILTKEEFESKVGTLKTSNNNISSKNDSSDSIMPPIEITLAVLLLIIIFIFLTLMIK